jgi:hypothetical protein
MSRRVSPGRARRLRAEEKDRVLGAVFREFLTIPEVRAYLDQWTIHIDPAATPSIRLTRRDPEGADHGRP